MNALVFDRAGDLPKGVGVFSLIDSSGRNLYVGAAESIKKAVEKLFAANKFLNEKSSKIETLETFETDLLEVYNRTVRSKKPLYNFSLAEENLYPHFKITSEKFPRVLVTRRISDDNAEYFGAFLPETGVRFMLGFINRMFRTRGCTIPIDGNFIVPCPEFYRKRCVAPCVAQLCAREKYLKTINLARLFLQNNQTELEAIAAIEIERSVEELNFERAAEWRDFSQTILNFLIDKQRNYSLGDATDTYVLKQTDGKITIHLVTQRGRKNLGRRTFVFENKINLPTSDVLAQMIWQFYAFHAPKEIYVPVDFHGRKFLEKVLRMRGGAAKDKFKINVLKKENRKVTVSRSLKFTEFEFGQENLKPQKSLEEVQTEFQNQFTLKKKPFRIEAFDVAHISGTDFVGAKTVWQAGKFVSEEYEFWFSDRKSELETLAQTIEKRFLSKKNMPDLILIDGGKSQLKVALKVLADKKIPIASAVKPPQKHNEISHFLFADGTSKLYEKDSNAAQILLKLRDEAHALANYIHRTKRETAHFYEVSQTLSGASDEERKILLQKIGSLMKIKNATEMELAEFLGAEKGEAVHRQLRESKAKLEPFIVPVRFDDPNGDAADLGRPLDLPEKFYRKMRGEKVGGGGRNRTDE